MTNIARTYHVSRIFRSTALARFSSILLSICIILVLGVLPAAAGPVPGTDEQNPNVNPLVRCEPTAVSANVGDTVTIDLYIQDVSNLYGLDFRVSYNPTIGQVVDQNMYIPGTQIQPLYSWTVPGFIIKQDTYLPSDIPPNCGVHCIWLAFTQLNPTPPANGSGPVARVTFLGLQPGTFPMNWINTALSAPGGIPITPVDRQACQVTFIDPMAVTLAGFDATAQPDHVLLAWETASELDNLGFNLYRGLSPDEPDLRQRCADSLDGAGAVRFRLYVARSPGPRLWDHVLLLARCHRHGQHGDAFWAGERDLLCTNGYRTRNDGGGQHTARNTAGGRVADHPGGELDALVVLAAEPEAEELNSGS
ncbi:MAG: hypothetical protein HZY76_13105 [Anaerolineae bacterium]|nr:MAG: hypothetical protein HZY76_13105 [Anaerolineae bacterium]